MGIGFADFDAGKRIFEGWIKRVGHRDEFEEIRVSIVEGPISGKPDGYTVLISSNPENTIRRKQQTNPDFQPEKIMLLSRLHRMTPAPGSPNLRMFRQAYEDFGFYKLFPAHLGENRILDMDLSLSIEKREINFVHSSAIEPNDPEQAVFAKAVSSSEGPPGR